MFSSSGYFRGVQCPYFSSGLCERQYCHFRHIRTDSSGTATTTSHGSTSSDTQGLINTTSGGKNASIVTRFAAYVIVREGVVILSLV